MICKNCIFWKRTQELKDFSEPERFSQYIETKTARASPPGFQPAFPRFDLVLKDTYPIGECSNEHFIYTQAGGCEDDDLRAALKRTQSLLYSDGEAYGAYFKTCEDFGCIHFKPKEVLCHTKVTK